jgi:hypothetical protein
LQQLPSRLTEILIYTRLQSFNICSVNQKLGAVLFQFSNGLLIDRGVGNRSASDR